MRYVNWFMLLSGLAGLSVTTLLLWEEKISQETYLFLQPPNLFFILRAHNATRQFIDFFTELRNGKGKRKN